MDYCSSCRRHLNGALVCPGCGAYAPDIDPATVDDRAVPVARTSMATTGAAVNAAADAAAAWEVTASDTWHDSPLHDETAVRAFGMDETAPQSGPTGDVKGAPPAPQGRAARRRQLARWKKNQRRAVVATAVALVGGGLTFAAMDGQATDRTQAATAPDSARMDAPKEQPTPDGRRSSTRSDTNRSLPTRPAQTPATNLPRQQSADPPRTNLPDTAATPQGSAASPTQPRTVSPPSGGTSSDDNSAPTQQPPPPAADDGDSSGSGSGSDSGTSQTSPAPTTTPPSELCLLVVCLG